MDKQQRIDELEADQTFDRTFMMNGVNGLRELYRNMHAQNKRLLERLNKESVAEQLRRMDVLPSGQIMGNYDLWTLREQSNLVLSAVLKEGHNGYHKFAILPFSGTREDLDQVFTIFLKHMGLWVQIEDVSGEYLEPYGITDEQFIPIAKVLLDAHLKGGRQGYREKRKALRQECWDNCPQNTQQGARKTFTDLFDKKCDRTLDKVFERTLQGG